MYSKVDKVNFRSTNLLSIVFNSQATFLFKFKIVIIMNGKLALNGMISDEEVENKEDVGGGEDSPGVIVNHLDTLKCVPTILFFSRRGVLTSDIRTMNLLFQASYLE